MKVILKTRIPNLGYEWDVVTVKDGYARNYLLPEGLASVATPALIKRAEKMAEERIKKMEEIISNAKKTAEKIAKITLSFKKKVKGKKLYGSVSEKDIVEALKKEHKLDLDKDTIQIKEHLKELGKHDVKIHLAEGVDAKVSVEIEAEE